MTGIITLWFGAVVAIPPGWVICDGNNGTPDLRNFIPVGAGDTYAVDASAGSVNHNHNFTSNMHTHNLPAGGALLTGASATAVLDNAVGLGTTDNGSSLPPYHSLAYIQKT